MAALQAGDDDDIDEPRLEAFSNWQATGDSNSGQKYETGTKDNYLGPFVKSQFHLITQATKIWQRNPCPWLHSV